MVKSREEVIAEFNEEVNMTAEELEKWLEDPKSAKAGTGVGIESGHKIIEILRKNPDKDPEKYDDDDIAHMRKVVSYAKRHLAQEDHLKDTKTREELENTKSTISLKNWGHDPVKAIDEEEKAEEGGGQAAEEKAHPEVEEEGKDAQSNGDEVPAQEARESSATKETAEEETATNKRKLDADQPGEDVSEAAVETAQTDGPTEPVPSAGEDEQDSEDRPRKKSKVDGKE